MRILAVLPYAPSLIRVRPYNLLRELGRRHELTILIAGPAPTPAELDGLQTITDDVYVTAVARPEMALNCVRALVRGEPLQAAVGHTSAAQTRVRDLLAVSHHDVVHIEHLRAAFVEASLPRDTPRVFDAVDCISLLWERTRRASHSRLRRIVAAIEYQATQRFERRLMRRFDQVAVTSTDDAAALQALDPMAPVTIVPNGVDLKYFSPYAGPRRPGTIVFSGKMAYHANVTAVLYFVREILPRIWQDVPDASFRIVGSAPPKAVLDLARTDQRIEVTGHLADLRPAIGSAEVAICPVTVKVGIQNKILEAMALGVPVVASAAGASGLMARPGQDLLVGARPEEIARHVVSVLHNAPLRAHLVTSGRRYVEQHHRWEAATTSLEGLYHQAIAAHRTLAPA